MEEEVRLAEVADGAVGSADGAASTFRAANHAHMRKLTVDVLADGAAGSASVLLEVLVVGGDPVAVEAAFGALSVRRAEAELASVGACLAGVGDSFRPVEFVLAILHTFVVLKEHFEAGIRHQAGQTVGRRRLAGLAAAVTSKAAESGVIRVSPSGTCRRASALAEDQVVRV